MAEFVEQRGSRRIYVAIGEIAGENPTTSNPLGAPIPNKLGQYTGGFGVINEVFANGATPSYTQNGIVGNLYQQPRSGTLIARFTF